MGSGGWIGMAGWVGVEVGSAGQGLDGSIRRINKPKRKH